MAARRKLAEKSRRLEGATTKRQRKRPRPCKRCAASARRRNCRSSFWSCGLSKFARRQNLLSQRFKSRIPMKRFEQRIETDRIQGGLGVGDRFFEQVHCLVS